MFLTLIPMLEYLYSYDLGFKIQIIVDIIKNMKIHSESRFVPVIDTCIIMSFSKTSKN